MILQSDNILLCTDTSRPPRPLEEDGKGYWFIDREDMELEINQNNFLEYGEHNGNLYGTHLDSVRQIIKQGLFFKQAQHAFCCLLRLINFVF